MTALTLALKAPATRLAAFGHAIAEFFAGISEGQEMARHKEITVATDLDIYFCDPHSPWQRGTNENTNGLLRQYFPKGKVNFSKISQEELDAVADQLNRRPRQTLGWQTPAQKLNQLLALTP